MTEYREVDMRRPPGVVVIAPGIGARLDGDELVIALRVGLHPAGPGKIRIERRRMLVDDMDVTAARVGLPQFDQHVRHAAAVFVEHMTVHDDAFAERFACGLDGEIVIVLAHRLMAVDWSGQFRQRMPHWNQRLRGRALQRAAIVRRQPRRMRREAGDGIGKGHWCILINAVIPGCATWRRPGIHTPSRGYGFRARARARPGMTKTNSTSRSPSQRLGRRRRTWWPARACRRASPCRAPPSSPAAHRSCRADGRARWRRHAD